MVGGTNRRLVGAWLIVALLALAAYSNSLHGPFVFDDEAAIPGNSTLPNWSQAFFPPAKGASTVSGRPLLNFSFALNYHFGGTNVTGYHVVNALIHATTALLLFGIVLRSVRASHGSDASMIALASAALWLLHPLQTESVTYIVQRAESLAAVFILLSLYAFVRSTELAAKSRSRELAWQFASAFACWAGILSKETAAATPLLIAIFDGCWVSPSWRAVLQRRWRYYILLASSWVLLIPLIGDGRGRTVGFGLGIDGFEHAATQIRAVAHYLSLAVWPSPLVFFYGRHWPGSTGDLVAAGVVVVTLAAITLVLLRRRSPLAFFGLAGFCLLLPSSALPVASEVLAEHRMYLPLATLIVGTVLAAHAYLGRWFMAVTLGVALTFAYLTHQRNEDYRSPLALWTDTVKKLPTNPYAHGNLGLALLGSGDFVSAEREFATAVKLEPKYAEAHSNLGNLAANAGRLDEAATNYEIALKLQPDLAEVHANYGGLLARTDRIHQAITHVAQAVRLKPSLPGIHGFLAQLLAADHRLPEAVDVMESAVAREPGNADAHRFLASLLEKLGRNDEAQRELQRAVRD